ncbi:polysaccharide lyase [Marinilabilia sp.]
MGKLDFLLLTLFRKKYPGAIVKVNETNKLKISFPQGKYGPIPGAQWKVNFKPVEKALLQYKIFIPDNFDFVKGGKLPGLGGGNGNAGGNVPNGHDGWSIRFMFKERGRLCAYSYRPDMSGSYGEKRFLKKDSKYFRLPRGEWVNIGLQVEMNNVGKKNGSIKCYINKELFLYLNEVKFRDTSVLGIDHLLFSTFFGGADSSYAPEKDCYLLFKDFVVSEIS